MNTKPSRRRPIGSAVIVHCTPGLRHRECRAALRHLTQPMLITHVAARARSAEIQLALPAGQQLTPSARQLLDAQFYLWTIAAWLGPGGTAAVYAPGGRWTGVATKILDEFCVDVLRLAFETPAR